MQAALWLAIMRENYLAIVWNNDIAPDPQLPLPQNFGWKLEAEMSGVIATSSTVKTQKATHILKKKLKKTKTFLAERHFQGKEESRRLQQPR